MDKTLQQLKSLINKNIIYYFISLILLLGFGYGKYVMEKVVEFNTKKTMLSSIEAEIPNLESQATTIQKLEQNNVHDLSSKNKNLPVIIYSSPYQNIDIESAGYQLVDQLIKLFQANGSKINEISFVNKPAEGNVGVLSVDITLDSSYLNIQNVLKKIYGWKYLASIKNVKLEHNSKNPSLLSTKLTIDLYVNKS